MRLLPLLGRDALPGALLLLRAAKQKDVLH
jgi:hypothetical protein